jgi:hypothetical protein
MYRGRNSNVGAIEHGDVHRGEQQMWSDRKAAQVCRVYENMLWRCQHP